MSQGNEPARLVKLLLPADLVRHMDGAILRSGGAYQDRNEYVTEAIRDRLAEEAAVRAVELPPSPPKVESAPMHKPGRDLSEVQFRVYEEPPLDDSVRLGDWRGGQPMTVPAEPTGAVNFGLHNRDLPTLWALDRLALLSGEVRAPVPWEAFVKRIRNEGAHVGSLLRQRDLFKPSGLKAGIGFPKPGIKMEASIDRFIAAAVGSSRRADGPFFVLALAGLDDDREQIAPSEPGLRVLGDMLERGLGVTLPQPPAAFECWWRFTRGLAPAEHAAWLKVLRVVSDQPTREELIYRFPEWRGHIATTNTVGFISRSREWGLVEPDLIDQRYRLTDLGAAVVGEA